MEKSNLLTYSSTDVLIFEQRLQQKKKLVKCIDLKKLPDGGAKLFVQIEELEGILKDLSLKRSVECPEKLKVKDSKETDYVVIEELYQNKSDNNVKNCKSEIKKIFTEDSSTTSFCNIKSINETKTSNSGNKSKNSSDHKSRNCNLPSDLHKKEVRNVEKNDGQKEQKVITKKSFTTNHLFSDERTEITLNSASDESRNCTSNCKVTNIRANFAKTKQNDLTIKPLLAGAKLGNFDKKSVKCSDFLSFSDLTEKEKQNPVEEFPKSPAFSQWRGESFRKIQLTDAKPLLSGLNNVSSASNYLGTYNTKIGYSQDEKTVKKLQACLQICPVDIEEESVPEALETKLMLHQKKALTWLLWRESQEPSGGIFADDMGLGKTLTMIALVLKQNESDNFSASTIENSKTCKGTLIVCLASIIHQWNSEIERHCKSNTLKVLVYHGKNRECDFKSIKCFDVVVTTYSILMQEYKSLRLHEKKSILFYANWERVILDEAHTIKNYKSQTADSVFALKANRRWAVTGTPIHNDLKDMYALLKFLRCTPFDDYNLWKKLISDYSESSNKRRDMLVKSILLRRCKNEIDGKGKPIIKLTKKNILCHYLTLSDTEKKIYLKLHKRATDKLNIYDKKSGAKNNSSLLVLLLRLQQCCNHTALLGNEVEDDTVFDSLSELSENLTALNLNTSDSNTSVLSDVASNLSLSNIHCDISDRSFESTKIKNLLEELGNVREINPKDKMIVISQWVSMLDIVSLHLDKLNVKYHVIKGNTKPEDREMIAKDFNYNPDGPQIMLLSLKAGGVGLNLIGANHMFLLDLHWNPALENQACDRIYRVGQIKDVFIHKFICKETIEEKIFNFQKEKKYIADHVLHGSQKVISPLSVDDFRTLFQL